MNIVKWLAIRALLLLSVLLLAACSYNSFNRTITIKLPDEEKPKSVTPTAIHHSKVEQPPAKPVVKKRVVPVKRKVTAKKQWSCVKVNVESLDSGPATPTDKLRTLKPADKDGMVRVLLDYIRVLKEHNIKLATQLRVVNGQLQKCQTR